MTAQTFVAPASIVAKYGMSARRLQDLVDEGVLAIKDGKLVEVEQDKTEQDTEN